MNWISEALSSAFENPAITLMRQIAGAFEDANDLIRLELELNGGEEITREGC